MPKLSYEELTKELLKLYEIVDNHEGRLHYLELSEINLDVVYQKTQEMIDKRHRVDEGVPPSKSQVQSLRASVINLSKKLFTHFKEHKDFRHKDKF